MAGGKMSEPSKQFEPCSGRYIDKVTERARPSSCGWQVRKQPKPCPEVPQHDIDTTSADFALALPLCLAIAHNATPIGMWPSGQLGHIFMLMRSYCKDMVTSTLLNLSYIFNNAYNVTGFSWNMEWL